MVTAGGDDSGPFAGRVRIRVNGLIVRKDALLLVKMKSPTRETPFWIPPGGGVELGETLEETLEREIHEETGLEVASPELWYISEYIHKPWHAVEFYFLCNEAGGELRQGRDPELDPGRQFILDCRFIHFDELQELPVVPEYLRDKFATDYYAGKKRPEFIATRPEER